MIEPEVVERVLREAFPDAAVVEVQDTTGTKDHFRATIASATFEGKSLVARHQLVYRALGALMRGPIHALSLETLTPADLKE